jgi:3',5'-cyclic AMP phosphodiesterase CpdA
MNQRRETLALAGIILICITSIGSVYLIFTGNPAPAPEVSVQGGYVLDQTTDQTVIRAMALSIQLNLSAHAGGLLNNHQVLITNINTHRVTFSSNVSYSIVYSNGSSNILRLETQLPNASITMDTSDASPLNFYVFGDSQGYQGSIQDIVTTANHLHPDMLFHCGDITPFGQEKQYQRFDDATGNLSVPLFLTAGNHDIKLNGGQRYQSRYGPSTYSFDFGGAHFTIFNSSAGDVSESILQWLEDDLSTAVAEHKFVFTHIPPFDPRPGGNHTLLNTTTATRLMNIFESESVNVVFAGHIHMFNVSTSSTVTYVITGGAGATLYETAEKGGIYHYVNVTVSGPQVMIEPVALEEPSFARDQVVIRGRNEDLTLTIDDLMQLPTIEGFSSFQNQLENWHGQGVYKGVKISDLLALVGGMTTENTLRVTANDGYQQEFCYGNVYPNESWYQLQGDMILAYSYNGTTVPDWSTGLRLAMLPEDGQYSNGDCLQTSAPGMGCDIYLSAGARWVRYTQIIEVVP